MPIMAPKVAFPAAFGILIGTCLFKILISDEELLILKGELQLYRNHYLYAEVAAHIVNASSACNLVYVKILQTALVVLVSTVGQVLARKTREGACHGASRRYRHTCLIRCTMA